MRRGRSLTAAGLAVALGATAVLTATTIAGGSPGVATQAPVGVNAGRVKQALAELPGIVRADMKATKIPGVATAVVYDGKLVYASGFGVRELGKSAKVDAKTVFQLASVSKPLSSSAISVAATKGELAWTDPVRKGLPSFTLKDPYVSAHVTLADMYEHRSGLPEHSGDLLEDMGYSQAAIFSKLKYEPLTPFRTTWAYSNYGLTSAGESAARRIGKSFEAFAQSELFKPLGMTSTTTTFANVAKRKDVATLHVLNGTTWKPNGLYDVDGQAPAGGISSNVIDLSKWVTMLLDSGKYQGKQLISQANLISTWQPTIPRERIETIGARSGFYGLGWNVGDDELGRVIVDHSGAFGQGGSTNVLLVPEAKLGIITLTNGFPIGVPEAINRAFLDDATYGKQTRDWLTLFRNAFAQYSDKNTQYSTPPKVAKPARPLSAYVGTYDNAYWGPITVRNSKGKLTFSVGPKHQTYVLHHYTGDVWWFNQRYESGTGQSGFTFAGSKDGKVRTATVQAWSANGFGTFTRS